MSQLFGQTLREAPSDAEIASHQLLLRAGFIRPMASGIFSYLLLARKTLNRIENILRQEIDRIGGQEMTMPIVHPADLWQETGRWYKIDAEMGRFKDRNGRDMVLAMTHEEAVADLVRHEVRSYRHLPRLVYHIQTKFRDDPRPRAGLIRVREFTMKDSYSLDADWEGLDRQYRAHYQAYFNIFHRCGLPAIAVRSDVGMMGGHMAHEFMYLTPVGEDTLLICGACGYSANRQVARFRKPVAQPEPLLPVERVATPGAKTIEDLASYLGIEKARTAKAVFLMASLASNSADSSARQERFVFAIIRGDMDVNETKLANALGAASLRSATEEEVKAVGAVPGYASPVGLIPRHIENNATPGAFTVVVDDLVPQSPNLVAGANQDGFHLRCVNYGRDYQADIITDIAVAREGDACPGCGAPLEAVRGVEVGNIFKLGTHFSEKLGCMFHDLDGREKPVIMGSYGIGSGRLLACIAEEHHDEAGLVWPVTVAPYPVHLVALSGRTSNETTTQAEALYNELAANGIDTLFDDRDESPGVKFNDSDLIGLPIRLTVSERAQKQGGVEMKRRDQIEKRIVPWDEIIPVVRTELEAMEKAILAKVLEVPYPE
jgi:prolyl-tRNA synthetase